MYKDTLPCLVTTSCRDSILSKICPEESRVRCEAQDCNRVLGDLDFSDFILFGVTGQKFFFSFQACEWLLIPLNYSLTFFLFMFIIVALDTVQSEWQNWYDQA